MIHWDYLKTGKKVMPMMGIRDWLFGSDMEEWAQIRAKRQGTLYDVCMEICAEG